MHELSIMEGIFDIITEHAAIHRLHKITAVNVVVGEISGVEPEALTFAFSCFARGTKAEGAEFTITRTPVIGLCNRCGVTLKGITDLTCKCKEKPDYSLLTGKELYVHSISGNSEPEGEDNG